MSDYRSAIDLVRRCISGLLPGLTLALAFILIDKPQPAAGQEEECGLCTDYEYGGPHKFTTVDGAYFQCAPNNCHYAAWSVNHCVNWHNQCSAEQPDIDALAQSLEARDAVALRQLIRKIETVEFNALRRSLDVLCGNRLVARIPVPTAFSAADLLSLD